ncbi:hypothetical protein IT570_08090 [Candidatus Sumerlaeota bacterium]|nr:hypothetical protein [Candidatus Sumerlaeota bacterium]
MKKTLVLASILFLLAAAPGAFAQQPVSAMIAPTAPTAAAPPAMPADQTAFLAAHKALALQALFGNDHDAVSRQWNSRAKEFVGVGKSARNWIGTIQEVSHSSDGFHLVVATSADGKNTVLFATDLPAKPGEKNLITGTGDDFALLQGAKVGDRVGFSGNVVAKKDGTLVLLEAGESTTANPMYAFVYTRVVSADQALREMADAQQQAAAKAAEEKALREEATKARPTDRDKFMVNHYYKIGGVTPLRAAPPSTNPDATPLPPPLQVPPETMIFVHAVQQVDGVPWYSVTADMKVPAAQRKGWINSKDLTEKENFAFDLVAIPTPVQEIRTETAYNQPQASARKPKPGEIRQVYIVENAKDELYHAPGCTRLRGQVKKIHIYEADKDGFKPCPVCFDTVGRRN